MTENKVAQGIEEEGITNGAERVNLEEREAFVRALALIEQLVTYDKKNLRIDEGRIAVGVDDVEVLMGGLVSSTEQTSEYKQKVIDSLVRKQISSFDKKELTAFVDTELTEIGHTIKRLKADLIELMAMMSASQKEIKDILQASATNSEVDVNTTSTSVSFKDKAQHMTHWFRQFEANIGSIFLFNQKKEALLAMKAASQDTTEHFTSEQTQLLEKIKEGTYTSLNELLLDLIKLGDAVVTTTYEVRGHEKIFNGNVDLITGSQIAARISSIQKESIQGSLSEGEIAIYLKNHAVTNEYNIRNTATALLLAEAEAKKKAGKDDVQAVGDSEKSKKRKNTLFAKINAFLGGNKLQKTS